MAYTDIDLMRPFKGCARGGLKAAFFDVTTTTSGTIDTAEGGSWGGTIELTDNEAGRYTITLGRAVAALAGAVVTLIGPDDTALTNGGGVISSLRADTLSTDGVIYLQFSDEDGLADTDVQSALRFTVLLFFFDGGED